MRILLDPVIHDVRNTGNNAMLQAAVDRLLRLWPDAFIDVVTMSPYLLKQYCPQVHPIHKDGEDYESDKRYQLVSNALRFVPRVVFMTIFELREEVWRRWPALTPGQIRRRIASLLRAGRKSPEVSSSALNEGKKEDENRPALHESVNRADLVVINGGQLLSDEVKEYTIPLLDRLEAANQCGKATAMVGQGVGPLQDLELRARAEAVLPLVDHIAVRDKQTSPELLNSLGVNPIRVMLTGDDAIEMAYEARATTMGNGIGVSMRVASYTGVENHHLEIIRVALSQAATKYKTRLIALPIAHGAIESDAEVIQQLMTGPSRSTGWRKFDTPHEIIKRTGQCRLVVTGTYHPAVFALAQGIPVVGLAKSTQYIHKFSGLADQFGCGCEVLLLDDEQLLEKLTFAIDTAWQSAGEVRPPLLEAAVRQIDSGRAAYQHLYELVESKNQEVAVGLDHHR